MGVVQISYLYMLLMLCRYAGTTLVEGISIPTVLEAVIRERGPRTVVDFEMSQVLEPRT